MTQHRKYQALERAINVALTAAVCACTSTAWAWNPLGDNKPYREVALSGTEWKKVDLKAGWAAGQDTELLIEINNKLTGPLACHGVLVKMQSGTEVNKAFSPYLYVAPGTSKQTGIHGVKKAQMKDYALTCSCWKKNGDTQCSDPQKQP